VVHSEIMYVHTLACKQGGARQPVTFYVGVATPSKLQQQ